MRSATMDPDSLGKIVQGLDRGTGLAIITEGLLGYLEPSE